MNEGEKGVGEGRSDYIIFFVIINVQMPVLFSPAITNTNAAFTRP
jgi:hypothetical protein